MMIKGPSDLQYPTFKFNYPISFSQLGSKANAKYIQVNMYLLFMKAGQLLNALHFELSSLCWW